MDVLIINADQLVVVGGQQGTDEAGNLVDTNLTAIRCRKWLWISVPNVVANPTTVTVLQIQGFSRPRILVEIEGASKGFSHAVKRTVSAAYTIESCLPLMLRNWLISSLIRCPLHWHRKSRPMTGSKPKL